MPEMPTQPWPERYPAGTYPDGVLTYTAAQMREYALAYGAAVREECARVADSAKVIPDFGDDKAAAETMTALLDLYFGVVAAAIRKD